MRFVRLPLFLVVVLFSSLGPISPMSYNRCDNAVLPVLASLAALLVHFDILFHVSTCGKTDTEIKCPEKRQEDKKKVALQGEILERCVTGINRANRANKATQRHSSDTKRQTRPMTTEERQLNKIRPLNDGPEGRSWSRRPPLRLRSKP